METVHLSLKPRMTSFLKETILFEFPTTTCEWKHPSKDIKKCLESLLLGSRENDLLNEWKGDLPQFYYLLETLKRSGFLFYTLFQDKPLLTLLASESSLNSIDLTGPFQLSRFAYLRHHNEKLIYECSLSSVAIEIHDPLLLTVFGTLSKPTYLADLVATFPQYSHATFEQFLKLLQNNSFLSSKDDDLPSWEFHDLLFHAKTRKRNSLTPFGATYRFLGKTPPSPPLIPSSDNAIALYRPDLKKIQEPSLTEVLEKRRSIREHGETAITIQQLGEFLYRTARVKELRDGGHYQIASRPYPGGGACYELEIYPLIHRCEGISPQLYRYDPEIHALDPISNHPKCAKLLEEAQQATNQQNFPQVLLLIAARFHRMAWKYESMAYAVILKNSGVLLQNFYLVATAMDLAPCAIGGGNGDLFAEIAGTNPHDQATVAEFMLGSRQM